MAVSVSDVLRDIFFISRVVLKGRIRGFYRVSTVDDFLNASSCCSDTLCLAHGRAKEGNREVSIRALVIRGSIAELIIERDGVYETGFNAFKKLLDRVGSINVNFYEIPSELFDLYPDLKQSLEQSLEAIRVEAPRSIPTVAASMPMHRIEVSKPEAKLETPPTRVAIERVERPSISVEIVSEIRRILRDLHIDVANVSLNENNVVSLSIDVRGIGIGIELDAKAIAWIAINRLIELRPELLGGKPIRIDVDLRGEKSSHVYDTELMKRIAYFNGAVLRILIPHGFYVTDTKTSIDPISSRVELVYSVKSIEKVVSRAMLSKLAYECVREIKKLWPGKIIVRLRVGLFTEGRAEA